MELLEGFSQLLRQAVQKNNLTEQVLLSRCCNLRESAHLIKPSANRSDLVKMPLALHPDKLSPMLSDKPPAQRASLQKLAAQYFNALRWMNS